MLAFLLFLWQFYIKILAWWFVKLLFLSWTLLLQKIFDTHLKTYYLHIFYWNINEILGIEQKCQKTGKEQEKIKLIETDQYFSLLTVLV